LFSPSIRHHHQATKPYHLGSDFTELNPEPRAADIVIVKLGYLEPELYGMAADARLALTPAGVDQDLKRLGHCRIHRSMWPINQSFNEPPDPRTRLIPSSNEPFVE
jgi:microcystin degradation protein MlrC